MTTTEQGPRTARDAPPVVGVFDEIGAAEHAVRRLHEVGFDRDAVALGLEQVETEQEETPAPPSLALPYAFGCSVLGGAACGLLAAFFAPSSSVTIGGFGWTVPTVLLLSLVGGSFGWMLGAILGYGDVSRREREDIPALVPMTEPVATVTVRSPGRPEEARTILRSIGAREVRGGATVQPDPAATRQVRDTDPRRDTGLARPLPRAGAAASATGTGQSVRIRVTRDRGRERAPVSGQARQGQGTENRTTLAIGVAVVTGAVLGLLGRRKKE